MGRYSRMAIAAAAVVLCLISGCKKKPSDGSIIDPPLVEITKSPKRGVAYDIASPNDLAALSKGVSWWYNWGKGYNANVPPEYAASKGMEYIPMLWGGNTSNADIAQIEAFILANPNVKYLLVMNEPNLVDQANRTPAQAAVDWLKYEQVAADLAAHGRTISIVGPAMTYGTMSGYEDPVVWLDAFYAAYRSANNNRDPKIDYLAFHWYDYGLAAQLDRLAKYGKQIWVTEMANWNKNITSYALQEQQMLDMVTICESRADVFRYAWFIGRGTPAAVPDTKFTFLLTPTDGQLTELGTYYIGLPFTK
jgi:hypothetical protein